LEGKLDITKLSFPAFFQSTDHYILLNAGSALGKGVGPLLVARADRPFSAADVPASTIALPGLHTTAHLLFNFAYPDAQQKTFMLFSAIEQAVLNGETDLGVLIHENRFTYHQRGLQKITDLGTHWENEMKVPVPLGGIAIRRNMDMVLQKKIDTLIFRSLQQAFSEYPSLSTFIRCHAQEMEEQVMRQHIDLYVNQYSLNLGADGRKAIETLYGVFAKGRSQSSSAALFLQQD
jgi:1,4-dihydroxy-6-naphthoate synthase